MIIIVYSSMWLSQFGYLIHALTFVMVHHPYIAWFLVLVAAPLLWVPYSVVSMRLSSLNFFFIRLLPHSHRFLFFGVLSNQPLTFPSLVIVTVTVDSSGIGVIISSNHGCSHSQENGAIPLSEY